jgi:hypothetical protein
VTRLDDAIECLREVMSIDEMATVCKKEDGYGIIIEVRSRDEHKRPHAHVKNLDGTKSGVIGITDKAPKNQGDIVVLSGTVDNDMKGKIVEWGKNMGGDPKMNNWERLIEEWKRFHPEQ